MKTRTLVSILIFVLAVFICVNLPLYADKGSIPFNANVKIFEPNQRAMIAWNGYEEILLLTTDLHASESTNVLEVIPLPSEPVAKEGDIEIFHKATELINEHLQQQASLSRSRSKYKGIEKELKTNEAIQYRFATPFLYYPLKITRSEEGMDVNAKNNDGETALMYASWQGQTEVAHLLIEAGAKE